MQANAPDEEQGIDKLVKSSRRDSLRSFAFQVYRLGWRPSGGIAKHITLQSSLPSAKLS